ncbi:MAG: CsbD family protein [Bdellovibrionia bacterium]
MTLNENVIKGKWLELKGEVQKAWGKLTNDELDKTQGDIKAISGLIQQKYGEAQETYLKKVTEMRARIEAKKEEQVAAIKTNLKN